MASTPGGREGERLLPPHRHHIRADEGQQAVAVAGLALAEQHVCLVDAIDRPVGGYLAANEPCEGRKEVHRREHRVRAGTRPRGFFLLPNCLVRVEGRLINEVPSVEGSHRLFRDHLLRLRGASGARHNLGRVKGMSMGLSQFLQRVWDWKPTSELLLSQQRRQTVQGMREGLDRGG
jgi:hypothetical protein